MITSKKNKNEKRIYITQTGLSLSLSLVSHSDRKFTWPLCSTFAFLVPTLDKTIPSRCYLCEWFSLSIFLYLKILLPKVIYTINFCKIVVLGYSTRRVSGYYLLKYSNKIALLIIHFTFYNIKCILINSWYIQVTGLQI